MQRSVVLIASADAALQTDLERLLGGRCELAAVPALDDAPPLIDELQVGVLVVDLRVVSDGGHSAARTLERLHLVAPDLDLVLIAAADGPEILERRAVLSGASLLRAPLAPERLAAVVGGKLHASPGDAPTPAADAPGAHDPEEVVLEAITHKFDTNSPQLVRMLQDLAIAAAHDVTILLIGETGSGKTYLSSLVHEASPRRNEPFLHVACGALPRELIESELFGHVKGAFTSAHADKEGKFLAAGRGTILLDEIDVLGPEQQVKLLRVIETGEFEPVGSNRTQRSRARLVVASNLDLQPLVEQGRFRPDLYYRLSMLKFDLPPLRRRKVDIIPLARKFIAKFQSKHGVVIERTDDAFFNMLLDYPWPGNVRELEHVVQRAVIYCRSGVLTAEHLPPHVLAGQAGPVNDPSISLPGHAGRDPTLAQQVALTEREIIEQTLFKNNFSRTNTARELGISRVTLYNKMKKFNLLR